MIWRIVATFGSLTFLGTGFSVLSDPNCVTAEIGGGGRVVGVTCRDDSYGTWTGSAAGLIMCLIGVGILSLIFWRNLKNLLSSPQISVSPSSYGATVNSESRGNINKVQPKRALNQLQKIEDSNLTEDVTQIKVCDKCKSEVHVFYPKCFNCEGITFTHKQVKKKKQSSSVSSEEAMLDAFQEFKPAPSKGLTPEFKTCPMCAEDIKFAAKKCRYCQHMMDV